jgi:FkbM family methyltransferase
MGSSVLSTLHHSVDSWAHPAGKINPVKRGIGRILWPLDQTAWFTRFAWSHRTNQGRVSRRFLATLKLARLWVCARILHRPSVVPIGTKSVIQADPGRFASLKAAFANPPDFPEMLVWSNYLRPGDLFIDVGSNVGSYTLWAADLGARVIALEPVLETFQIMLENVRLNGYDVQTLQAAAGTTCGSTRFTSGLDDQNRIDSSGDIEVEMVTMDSVIEDRKVAGMKVDVEGFEIDVLRGCERALQEQRIGLLQLEWNSTSESAVNADRTSIVEFLRTYGYGLYRPDSTGTLVPITDYGYGHDVFAQPSPA